MTESETDFDVQRWRMVQIIQAYAEQSEARTGKPEFSDRVMRAAAKVPRHQFVPAEVRRYAYQDGPLPIGYDKTISQPFIVALMTDLLDIRRRDRVLEIGGGLGYHTALLAELSGAVYSIEIIEELAQQAQENLSRQGYDAVECRIGDGSRGWPEHAPFDRILVGAAAEPVPTALLDQLARGGRMVIPTGAGEAQALTLIVKHDDGHIETRDILPVRFALLESYH